MRIKFNLGADATVSATLKNHRGTGNNTLIEYRTDSGESWLNLLPVSQAVFEQAVMAAAVDMGELDMTDAAIAQLKETRNDDGSMKVKGTSKPMGFLPP